MLNREVGFALNNGHHHIGRALVRFVPEGDLVLMVGSAQTHAPKL